jgi:hypothetical protein
LANRKKKETQSFHTEKDYQWINLMGREKGSRSKNLGRREKARLRGAGFQVQARNLFR